MAGASDNAGISEVYPVLWSANVAAIVDWAVATLGFSESWRSTAESGEVEHAELGWPGGRISVNVIRNAYRHMGPSGIALRMDDRERVDALYARASATNAHISQALAEDRIAYSFTVIDPDGNQWWVNVETGFLDQLRSQAMPA